VSRGEGRIAFLLFPAANRAGQRNAVYSLLRAVEQYQVGLGLADGLQCQCRFANGDDAEIRQLAQAFANLGPVAGRGSRTRTVALRATAGKRSDMVLSGLQESVVDHITGRVTGIFLCWLPE
jgi:hypothetical protein